MPEFRNIVIDDLPSRVEVHEGTFLRGGKRLDAASYRHLLPCAPKSVICVHLNYLGRLNELGFERPPAPTYFTKPTSCLNVHGGDVMRPPNCNFLNYEGEVALVIGKTARNVSIENASTYIAGYTIANDFGLHDFRDTDANSMLRVKGSDTLGAIGPGLVTDWTFAHKRIITRVNGIPVQDASTDDLIWDPHYLVADITRTITLNEGDLILTGTPPNSRPVQPGDEVEVEVEGLGVLTNRIVEGNDPVPTEYGAQPSDSKNVRAIALGLPRDVK